MNLKFYRIKFSTYIVSLFLFLTVSSCSSEANTAYLDKIDEPELFQAAMQNLTDIVVYDIFSPPVASRVYLYPSIAAYEVIANAFPDQYNSLVGQVQELQPIPKAENERVNAKLASLFAFNTVGKALIFSEDKMDLFVEKFNSDLEELNVPRKVVRASHKYGAVVATSILEWASKDMYNQTRT